MLFYYLLLSLSLRFFLFDFLKTRWIRIWIFKKNIWIINELFKCQYCQGFWCGLLVGLLFIRPFNLLELIMFMFISAYLSLFTCIIFYPMIENFENISCMFFKNYKDKN